MGSSRILLQSSLFAASIAVMFAILLPNCYLFALPNFFFLTPYASMYIDESGKIDLSERVAVILGASQGLGADLAREFSTYGASIVLASRNMQKLEGVRNSIIDSGVKSEKILVVKCDITNESDRLELTQKTDETFGRADFLIINTGVNSHGHANTTDIQIYRDLLEINALGSIDVTQRFLPFLQESGGLISAVSSLTGRFATPLMSAYSVSKFAMEAYYRSLRAELTAAKSNVHIIMVDPGSFYGDDGRQVLKDNGSELLVAIRHLDNRMHSSEVAKYIFDATIRRKREVHLSGILGLASPIGNFFIPATVERIVSKKLLGYDRAVRSASS